MNIPTTIDEIEVVTEPRTPRGMRACPRCHRSSLRLVNTRRIEGEATRGAVCMVRSFSCTSANCDTTVRFVELSVGAVTKRSVYGFARDAAPAVEVLASAIVVKA